MNAPANIDSATLHNIDLEQEILGSVIINNSAFDVIDSKLTAADFFEPLHCRIFDAIRNVHALHGVVTPALIIASIGGDASQTIVDGVNLRQYIARLAAAASVPRNAPAYAKQIREFADRRKMLATAETISVCIQNNQPAADIAGLAIEALDEIAAAASAGSTPQVSLSDANQKSLERMQWGMQNPGRLAGIS
jgi:replicative DNA helicase